MMGLSVLHHSVFLQKWGSVELLKVEPRLSVLLLLFTLKLRVE